MGKRDGGPDRHHQMTNVLLDLLTKQQEKEHLDTDAQERRQVLHAEQDTPKHKRQHLTSKWEEGIYLRTITRTHTHRHVCILLLLHPRICHDY